MVKLLLARICSVSPRRRQQLPRIILAQQWKHFLPSPECKNRNTRRVTISTTFDALSRRRTRTSGAHDVEVRPLLRSLQDQNAAGLTIDGREYVRWNIHRADSVNRLGLCQQQFGPHRGSARADRPSARRRDAGLERARRCAERAAETRRLGQEVDHAGPYRLPRGRKEVQITQAPSAHAIQYDA